MLGETPHPQEQAGRSTDTRSPTLPPRTAWLRPHPEAAPWPPLSLPARCSGPATCLFCHGVRMRPFHFNGEYPEREPTTQHLQPTAGSLPGESNAQKSPAGYRPWGREGADTTQVTSMHPTQYWSSILLKKLPPTQELKGARVSVPPSVDQEPRGRAAQRSTWLQTRCHQGRPLSRGRTAKIPDRLPAPRLPRSRSIWQLLLLSRQQTRLRRRDPLGRAYIKPHSPRATPPVS